MWTCYLSRGAVPEEPRYTEVQWRTEMVHDLSIVVRGDQKYCGLCDTRIESAETRSRQIGIDDSSPDARDWHPMIETTMTLLPCGHSTQSVHCG